MTIREQEDLIRFQNYETAIAWDTSGAEVLKKDGERYSITFTDEELDLLSGAVLTHNHPRGLEFPKHDPRSYGNSFSEQDLRLACYARLAELRVVTPRLRFSLKPSAAGWDEDYWESTLAPVYADYKNVVSQEFRAACSVRAMTLAEAEARYFHEICTRVAGALQLPYVREES